MDWNLLKDKTPICYETGDWDGKRSDLCICMDEKEKYHLAYMYEYNDRQFEWYDQDDYGLRYEIIKWFYLTD